MHRTSMKIQVLIFSFLLICATSWAQKSPAFKKGERHFQQLSYVKAIRVFESIINENDEEPDPDVIKMLADSYRFLGNTEQSEFWYAKVLKSPIAQPLDTYFYAQALKGNGKYEESDKWMEKFFQMDSDDSRAMRQRLIRPDFIETLKADSIKYTIIKLDINSMNSDFGPAFYRDQIVFSSARSATGWLRSEHTWNNKPFLELYASSKAEDLSLNSPSNFSSKLNTRYHEGPVSFNDAGDVIYFTRNNYHKGIAKKSADGINKLKIYRAYLRNGKWQGEEEMPFNTDNFSVGHPSLSPDGKRLYFASDIPGGIGGTDIYYAPINPDSSLGKPVNLGDKINTEGNEMFPFIHENGALFFASDGHPGLGGLDVFASLPSGNSLGKPINMGYPLNTPKDDFGLILGKDQKTGYFSSNRGGGEGDDDVYAFKMYKVLKPAPSIAGVIKDKDSGMLLPGAEVILSDADDKQIMRKTVGNDASFFFELDEDKYYNLRAVKKDYFQDRRTESTFNLKQPEITGADLALEKDPGLMITGRTVMDGKPKENVNVVVYKFPSGEKLNKITSVEDGKLRYLPEEPDTFILKVEDPKYLVNRTAPLALVKGELKAGDIKLLPRVVDGWLINDIYYDYDKSNIRPDAAIELDKLIQILNNNPTLKIYMRSHCDSRASNRYNIWLSGERAKSAIRYLTDRGIDRSRITRNTFHSEDELINECGNDKECEEAMHQRNRRTEIRIDSY